MKPPKPSDVGNKFDLQRSGQRLRPVVSKADLDKQYREMAADKVREAEAREWCEALIGDVADVEPISAVEKEQLFADAAERAHWDDPEFDVYDDSKNPKRG